MKRSFYLYFLLYWFSQTAFAQKKIVSPFKEAEGKPYSMQRLDAAYKSAVHTDTSQAVFHGEAEKRLAEAYQKLVQEVGQHLASNGFSWGKPVRCFNRFYFSSDGSIDYYLFNISPDHADPDKQKEFQRLMEEFIHSHRIGITGPQKFSQCSPVVYRDPGKS